jgi:hypothetical protein
LSCRGRLNMINFPTQSFSWRLQDHIVQGAVDGMMPRRSRDGNFAEPRASCIFAQDREGQRIISCAAMATAKHAAAWALHLLCRGRDTDVDVERLLVDVRRSRAGTSDQCTRWHQTLGGLGVVRKRSRLGRSSLSFWPAGADAGYGPRNSLSAVGASPSGQQGGLATQHLAKIERHQPAALHGSWTTDKV